MKQRFFKCLRSFCLFLIKTYQVFMSTHLGGACRFYPSCSHYAESVLLSLPLLKAWRMILKRLSSCHFFGPYGLDLPPLPTHPHREP